MFLKHKKGLFKKGGFTLIELLVVFFIMVSILAIIIPDYLSYSDKSDFDNLTLDIALTIREAQSYGISAKETFAGSGNFDIPYGVHFDINKPNGFLFFEDTNKDYMYIDTDDNVISTYTVKPGYALSGLCRVKDDGNSDKCKVECLSTTFRRPSPNAWMGMRKKKGSSCSNNLDGGVSRLQDNVRIELTSPSGTTKSINITPFGSVSVPNN